MSALAAFVSLGSVRAADAPLELKWAQLMPPAAPPSSALKPKTFFGGSTAASPDGGPPPPPLAEGGFMSVKRRQPGGDRPPQVVEEFNGKRVRLGGYVVPLDFEATTIKEFLLSAEYVLAGGNPNVILCERGIRTFETATRFTLDLNAVPVIKKLSHLPVVVDPSHGTGHWEYVAPMAKAGLACGADGLLIEVHHRPEEALSDGPQSLKPDKFARLMAELRALAAVLGRTL